MLKLNEVYCGDVLELVRDCPQVDLIFGSPPYEDARKIRDDGFEVYKGEDWVKWMVDVTLACLAKCRGLVAFVVQGRTKNYAWSGTPMLLQADLIRLGVTLRDPIIYHRVGIPGSGGPDWMRHDCEYVICATNGGRLPWSDNTACGHPPKYGPGGDPSHRRNDGYRTTDRRYSEPKRANPGNLVHCHGGGGHLGSDLAHKNEAPFPESLAEFFVKSFCPPGGTVLDPFSGSGTTCAVAKRLGRNYIGFDIRQSQVELTNRRLKELT